MAAGRAQEDGLLPRAEWFVVLGYLLVASLWIIFSDVALAHFTGDNKQSTHLQTFKGLNFVITTAGLLYLVLRRSYSRRRLAEAAARANQERFELVAFATNDAVWDWNLATNELWWGEGFQKLFGHAPEEVEPTLDSWTNRLHPEDRERSLKSLHDAVETGQDTWSDEYRFRRKDGSYADVLDRGYVLRDSGGKAIRVVGGMTDITARKLAEKNLERSRRQLRALTARLESSREEERTRIAREIHDELGQLLTGLKMDLRWIERKLTAHEHAATLNPVLDKAVEASALADSTIASVQRISSELRPSLLDNLGLDAALRHEAQRFQEQTGVTCRLEIPDPAPDLGQPVATALFRIFQETLTNVARHAEAKGVVITLRDQDATVILSITDNGKGLPAGALYDPKSIGLAGMKERASVLGGELVIAPGPAGGTTVTLTLPRTADDTRFWQNL
jgi:PAS domain S-box-containing protein